MSNEKIVCTKDGVVIREAKREDMAAVASMIQELAEFEDMPDGPKINKDDLEHDGFESQPPAFRCLVAEILSPCPHTELVDTIPALELVGTHSPSELVGSRSPSELIDTLSALELVETLSPNNLVGYALYFPIYSTWSGRSCQLEDLYVRPAYRKRGIGGMLFDSVAKMSVSAGSSRLDFHVLRWNPAADWYSRRGANDISEQEDWHYWRLTPPQLHQAASRVSPSEIQE